MSETVIEASRFGEPSYPDFVRPNCTTCGTSIDEGDGVICRLCERAYCPDHCTEAQCAAECCEDHLAGYIGAMEREIVLLRGRIENLRDDVARAKRTALGLALGCTEKTPGSKEERLDAAN